MARGRKRNRRSGRPDRPADATPPRRAGGFGLPDDSAEPGVQFPAPEALEGDAVSVAASAFGEPPASARHEAAVRAPHGNRVIAFLRGCWAELQRVQWPDRRQVAQATGVVLGFVVIAAVFLGLADELSSKIVDAIL
ncbi:MAG: preprotein translocase subunit SecE [Solirubrobacteraceae bacterium]